MLRLEETLRKLAFMAVLLASGSMSAQQAAPGTKDSVDRNQSGRIYPLPILYYTPETGVAGGAAALYAYRHQLATRLSTLSANVIYTQKKHLISEIGADQYFSGDRYRLTGFFAFQRYPDKFFGIGNNTPAIDEETYTQVKYMLQAVLYRNLISHFNIGPVVQYEYISMKEVDPQRALASGTLPGSRGGTSAGMGFAANWDSRDNTFAAESGSFIELTAVFHRRAFGSDYSYNDILIDIRKYINVLSDHVIALQGVAESVDGSAPFQRFAKIGGQNVMRGYFDGRYRDKNAVAIQAEYRVPLWWRMGIVAFAGAAQVSDRIGRLGIGRFWYTGGTGLRYAWDPKEKINLRLDYGVGSNSSGVYITATEAF